MLASCPNHTNSRFRTVQNECSCPRKRDNPFDTSSNGSPTDPKTVDAGNSAAVEGVETSANAKQRIEAGRRPDTFASSSEPHYLDWKTIPGTARPGFENGMPPESLRRPELFPIALDRVLEYMLGNPRLQPVADGYFHAACSGAFIASLAVELRIASCGMRHRRDYANFRSDSGSRLSSTSGNRRNDRDYYRDGSGSNRDNFKTARPAREAAAPRITFSKDITKDFIKNKANKSPGAPSKQRCTGVVA
eukprot:jgi/Tetstr1/423553/TSEL_014226.t1